MAEDKKGFDAGVLRRVMGFTRPYKGKFILSLVLAILLAIVAPLRPWLIQLSIQQGLDPAAQGFFLNGPGAFLLEITIIQVVLLVAETAARFFFTYTSSVLGQSVVKDMRVATYDKILHLNLRQFDRTPIGTLTTRTINDLESVNDIFSDGLIPILADVLSIASVLAYMFSVNWKLTLVCLSVFPIMLVATYYFKESVNKSYMVVRTAVANLNAFVQEHITGMSVVQAFAMEDREMNKFREINKVHRDANIRAIFAYSVFFPLVELVSALSTGLLVWWAARQTIGMPPEEAGNFAGVVTSFILCLNLLFRPLRVLADKFNVLQMGVIAASRVFGVLDNADTTVNEGTHEPETVQGKIEFKDVSFAYVENVPVLRNISFTVEAGQTLAIVGHTGSGKSTIISLLSKLYEVSSGQILIDDVDIDDYSLAALRMQIAIVLQDVFLFKGTITENITLRDASIPESRVKAAAEMIGLSHFIEQLPDAYNFDVRERGGTLSNGQRQLISFVRAVLANPSILVLDEATSSVDTITENLIQQAIEKLVAGRTAIIIAHRLSTIRKADKILVLDKGTLIESGSHAELMAKQGAYYNLYHHQFETAEAVGINSRW